MRGLTLLVVTGDPERLHAALSYAAAAAVMGMVVRIHLHDLAVGLLGQGVSVPSDVVRTNAGLPTLAQIWEEALSLGVTITLCQNGLALAGLAMDQLDPRIAAQGPVGLLATLGDDRLVVF